MEAPHSRTESGNQNGLVAIGIKYLLVEIKYGPCSSLRSSINLTLSDMPYYFESLFNLFLENLLILNTNVGSLRLCTYI